MNTAAQRWWQAASRRDRWLVVIGMIVAVFLAFGWLVDRGTDDTPGDNAVYQRINAETSCGALQHEFDVAYANAQRVGAASPDHKVALSYMATADDRMNDIGCYDAGSERVRENR